MSDKAKYNIGDRVKCYHGPIMYSAKCVKYEIRDKVHTYFVHYEGWNKNWDEWVPESRIHPHTEDVRKKTKNTTESHEQIKEIISSVGRKKKKEIESDGSRPSTPAHGDSMASKEVTNNETPGGRKRTASKAFSSDKKSTSGRRDSRVSKREKLDHGTTPTSTAAITACTGSESASISGQSSKTGKLAKHSKSSKSSDGKLKSGPRDNMVRRLSTTVDKEKMEALLRLPARKTIEDIMNDYINSRETPIDIDRISTFCEGIKEYFNTSLGKILLYKFERHQYADAIKQHADLLTLKKDQVTPINDLENKLKEKQLVRIYGVIHLVRLFTRIGDMLTFSDICKSTLKYIIKFVEDFSVYISEFPEYYSEENYYLASPEYLRLSLDIVS